MPGGGATGFVNFGGIIAVCAVTVSAVVVSAGSALFFIAAAPDESTARVPATPVLTAVSGFAIRRGDLTVSVIALTSESILAVAGFILGRAVSARLVWCVSTAALLMRTAGLSRRVCLAVSTCAKQGNDAMKKNMVTKYFNAAVVNCSKTI